MSQQTADFERFVALNQNMVYSTALRLVGSVEEAQDIAQETFIQAYRHFDSLFDSPGAHVWLRTTARNLGLNHITRYRNRFKQIDDDASLDIALTYDQSSDDWLYDNSDLLRRALIGLPTAFRAPLVLHYYEGYDYQEVAQALSCSLSKVKTDISRGKAKLRILIERLEPCYADNQA